MNASHGIATGPADDDRLAPETEALIDAVIGRHQGFSGALITVLEALQEEIGYLPRSVQRRVARGLKVPLAEIYGVVTFYHFFTMVPRGRHTIRCCLGTACYVRGGKGAMDRVRRLLALEPGGTSADRRYSLETVRCLGACGLAPVMMVDNDTHRQVKPATIGDILDAYE